MPRKTSSETGGCLAGATHIKTRFLFDFFAFFFELYKERGTKWSYAFEKSTGWEDHAGLCWHEHSREAR